MCSEHCVAWETALYSVYNIAYIGNKCNCFGLSLNSSNLIQSVNNMSIRQMFLSVSMVGLIKFR